MTTRTKEIDLASVTSIIGAQSARQCNGSSYYTIYAKNDTSYDSLIYINTSNLQSLVGSYATISSVTAYFENLKNLAKYDGATVCDDTSTIITTAYIGCGCSDTIMPSSLSSESTSSASQGEFDEVTASYDSSKANFIIGCRRNTSSSTNQPRFRITKIKITYSFTCSISGATKISSDGISFVENTESTPLTISKPSELYFLGTASCNDSSCGSIESCSWALRKGTSPSSGTILQSNLNYIQGIVDGVHSSSYASQGSGKYNIVFASTGCDSSTYQGQVFYELSSVDRNGYYSLDNGTTWYQASQDITYNVASPRNVLIKYEDSWGGYYNIYIGYKLSTASEYTWYTSASSTFIKSIGMSRGHTYDIILAYGTSSTQITTALTFKLAVTEPEVKGYYNVDSGTYNEINNTYSYCAEVPKTSGITIGFKYTNTYGSESYKLRIYLDGVLVQTSTTTTATYSKTFTENGNHGISYRVYDGTTETVSLSFTITVVGIFINSNARINVNGTPIWNNISKNVAQYSEQPITITGMTGLDLAGARFSWAVTNRDGSGLSNNDYTISSTTAQSPTIKFNNSDSINVKYRLTCTISYEYQYTTGTTIRVAILTFGDGEQSTSTMGYVTCSGQTIAKIQSMNRHEGDTSNNFEVFGKAVKPTASGEVGITGVWSLKRGSTTLVEGTDYVKLTDPVIPSGSTSNSSFAFRMNIYGEFKVHFTTETITSYTSGTDDEDFKVHNITTMELPMESRHSIVLYNDTYVCVLNRMSDDNHTTVFDQLVFSSGLNKVGSASFNVIGGNNLTCKVWNTSTSSFVSYSSSSLLNNNTRVIIVDNDCPIWTGVITSVDQVNVNFYNSLVNTSIVKITCEESTKELSYTYTESKAYTGTVGDIAEELLDDYAGEIGSTLTNYSISFDVSSVLSALDSLSSQVGWRYRCRPYIGSYGNSFIVSGSTYTVTHGTVSAGDYVIIYDGTISPTTSHPYAYNNGYYHIAKIRTVASGSTTDTVTLSSYQSMPSNGTYKFSTCKGFLIDFKPAYYQEYAPMSFKINDVAQNVNAIDTASDKFGEVSVYGVGNSGETISSTMKAWMTINKDYTIPYSARIIKSYDSSIDSISMTKQFSAYYQYVTEYVYSEFTITLNGWSFPTNVALLSSHQPTIFYKNGNNIRSMVLSNPEGLTINRFTDQSGMNKTTVTCAYPVTMGDGTAISLSDTYARDTDGRLFADIISSLAPQTNVIFDIYLIDAGDYVITDVLTTGSIRIGDSEATCTSVNNSGDLIINWITTSSIPHGHMTDILVMDNTGTKYPSGCSYNNEAADSPYAKYPNVKKTVQGAEGYSAMELERLACRYMQYGSNYDSEGSADIVYNYFCKSDYELGCIRTPSVGDRIQFQKVLSSTSSGVEYTLLNFELITYSVDLSKNMASVTFGMPFVEIGDILYNMLSNSGMSIIPATNSTGS